MFSGYIAITNPDWYRFNKSKKHTEVVFWRKAVNPLNLSSGMSLFFLVKGTNPRYIRGYGIIKLIGSETVKQLWEKYGEKMGFDAFELIMRKIL